MEVDLNKFNPILHFFGASFTWMISKLWLLLGSTCFVGEWGEMFKNADIIYTFSMFVCLTNVYDAYGLW